MELKVDSTFLVPGCVTNLGEETERVIGYFPAQPDWRASRPWRWDRMRENADRIVHIGSYDDCFIPVEQGRRSSMIARNMSSPNETRNSKAVTSQFANEGKPAL